MSWGCRILKVDPERPDEASLRVAAEAIRRGGLVAFPTETVYGLGADALNPRAVKKIFEVKGRPPDNPLIVHISDWEMLGRIADEVPKAALKLARKFWPGPLTLVLKRKKVIPDEVTAGLPTVAVRMPAHEVALKLIRLSDTPIAAPSANPSGRPSPTTGSHVLRDLDCKVDVILDGGETYFGLESTIIDVTRNPPVLLRPGPIAVEDVEKALGERVMVTDESRGLSHAERPLAPGMKYRHYAPDTPVVLVDVNPSDIVTVVESAVRELNKLDWKAGLVGSTNLIWLVVGYGLRKGRMPLKIYDLGRGEKPHVAARRLYHVLRKIDEHSLPAAVVLPFPEEGIGLAVMNRLRKAASRRVSG